MTAKLAPELQAEIRRLRLDCKLPLAKVAQQCGVSTNAVRTYTQEHVAQLAAQHRLQNKEKKRAYDKQHAASASDRKREKHSKDLVCRASVNLKRQINRLIDHPHKKHQFIELLGCSAQELLEKWPQDKVQGWKTSPGYHIDHIRPCSSFDLTDPAQQQVCFNWRNLQLLTAQQNRAKGAVWTPEMQEKWTQRMKKLEWEGELFLVDQFEIFSWEI